MTDKILIDRELLERELLSVLDFSESNLRRVVDHLIDVGYTRAAPRQPAGWKLVPVEPTPEMVSAAEEAHMPFGDMDIALRMAILAAPSAPKADDPVKQMLLEALENTATWIEQLPVPTVGAAGQLVKIDKAITAARKGEGE